MLSVVQAAVAATPVFINEFHYDNAGADSNETIEIAGPAGIDLTDWSLALYNGNGGTVYEAVDPCGNTTAATAQVAVPKNRR